MQHYNYTCQERPTSCHVKKSKTYCFASIISLYVSWMQMIECLISNHHPSHLTEEGSNLDLSTFVRTKEEWKSKDCYQDLHQVIKAFWYNLSYRTCVVLLRNCFLGNLFVVARLYKGREIARAEFMYFWETSEISFCSWWQTRTPR